MTNANINTNKGSGDKAHHYDNATTANARTYYQKVHDMSRDEAKAKVDALVKSGNLQSSAFYVGEIAKEAKRRENVEKRKAQEQTRANEKKARDEAEKRAREDFERRRAERETQDNGEYKLASEIEAQIRDFIAKGCSKAVIKGMLTVLAGLNKKQIEKAIADLMPERAKTQRVTFNSLLDSRLIEKGMNEQELDAFIAEFGNDNAVKNRAYHLKRAQFANALHAKYNKG